MVNKSLLLITEYMSWLSFLRPILSQFTLFEYLMSLFNSACWVIFHAFVVVCWLFSKFTLSKKFFQKHYQSVKRFRSRSGPRFCQSWSGSKLFAKVISGRQKLPLVRKELNIQAQLSIQARPYFFGLRLPLLPFYVYMLAANVPARLSKSTDSSEL